MGCAAHDRSANDTFSSRSRRFFSPLVGHFFDFIFLFFIHMVEYKVRSREVVGDAVETPMDGCV